VGANKNDAMENHSERRKGGKRESSSLPGSMEGIDLEMGREIKTIAERPTTRRKKNRSPRHLRKPLGKKGE